MPHAPKSVLRHRPIEPDTSNTSAQTQEPPQVPRASQSQSHARPASHLRKKTRAAPTTTTTTMMRPASVHWSISFGFGLLLMLVLFFIGQHVVSDVTLALDDLHYGRPRTYQIDAVVGHNDSAAAPSHFLVHI